MKSSLKIGAVAGLIAGIVGGIVVFFHILSVLIPAFGIVLGYLYKPTK